MSDIMKTIKENDVKFVDLRFTDTKGKEQHVTLPASAVDESLFKDGKMFDADGNEMDSDDIEDLYYQDAFDGDGNNVGIDIKNENYNPSDKFLTESVDLLKREFGAPLPTLQSVMEKHQKNIKEGPDDVKVTKKQLQMLIKQEGDFRKRMLNIEQGFLRDPRPENKKLAKEIKKSYKDNVTKFMREVVGMLKRMK